MDADDVAEFLDSLPGCRRRGPDSRPAWYVHGRLVCRLEDPTTLTIRSAFGARERLLAEHPDTFGVPPHMEKHQKVQAVLGRGAGSDAAIRASLQAAYDLQHN